MQAGHENNALVFVAAYAFCCVWGLFHVTVASLLIDHVTATTVLHGFITLPAVELFLLVSLSGVLWLVQMGVEQWKRYRLKKTRAMHDLKAKVL